jgi:hypothetical protein
MRTLSTTLGPLALAVVLLPASVVGALTPTSDGRYIFNTGATGTQTATPPAPFQP